MVLKKKAHSSKHLEVAEKQAEAQMVRQEEQATKNNRKGLRSAMTAKFSASLTRRMLHATLVVSER